MVSDKEQRILTVNHFCDEVSFSKSRISSVKTDIFLWDSVGLMKDFFFKKNFVCCIQSSFLKNLFLIGG